MEHHAELHKQGFTLIELLVVIAIIGILSSIIFTTLDTVRDQARDSQRLADMQQIITALEQENLSTGHYPSSDRDGSGSWDVGNQDYQLLNGRLTDQFPQGAPNDPITTGNYSGYFYYRYGAGHSGCNPNSAFYILGIKNLENTEGTHPDSPGWSCPNRNWQGEFEWVTGKYESI